MPKEFKIEEQFVVDGKTFTSKEEAQQYLESLENLQKNTLRVSMATLFTMRIGQRLVKKLKVAFVMLGGELTMQP